MDETEKTLAKTKLKQLKHSDKQLISEETLPDTDYQLIAEETRHPDTTDYDELSTINLNEIIQEAIQEIFTDSESISGTNDNSFVLDLPLLEKEESPALVINKEVIILNETLNSEKEVNSSDSETPGDFDELPINEMEEHDGFPINEMVEHEELPINEMEEHEELPINEMEELDGLPINEMEEQTTSSNSSTMVTSDNSFVLQPPFEKDETLRTLRMEKSDNSFVLQPPLEKDPTDETLKTSQLDNKVIRPNVETLKTAQLDNKVIKPNVETLRTAQLDNKVIRPNVETRTEDAAADDNSTVSSQQQEWLPLQDDDVEEDDAPLFKCEKCEKSFRRSWTFKQHDCYICEICGRRKFKSKMDFQIHIVTHARHQPFECSICSKDGKKRSRFTLEKDLRRHEARFHNDGKKYRCLRCCREFLMESSFKNHNVRFYQEEKCPKCPDKIFCNERDLNAHTLKTHPIDKNEGNKELNKQHGGVKKKKQRFSCKFCDKKYESKSSLGLHVRNYHRNSQGGASTFTCLICGKIFYTKGGLKIHTKNIHEKNEEYRCPDCPETSFRYKRSLDRHNTINHSHEGGLMCQHCARIFAYNHELQRHLQVHDTSKKSFLCHVCGRKFIRADKLRNHMFVHTGNAPHKCIHCEKGFSTKRNLYDHIQTHPGVEKAFACSECSERFIRPDHLKRHLLRVHNQGFGTRFTGIQNKSLLNPL